MTDKAPERIWVARRTMRDPLGGYEVYHDVCSQSHDAAHCEYRLVHQPNPGQTHWTGCYTEPGHQECAVAEVARLRDEMADYDNAILRRFDPSAAGSTDLHTFINCMQAERDALRAKVAELEHALNSLVLRCDGEEGVRADGSNIDTLAAHAVLGDFTPYKYANSYEVGSGHRDPD